MFKIFILLWGAINLLLCVVAYFRVKRNPKNCDFIWWWAFPAGAFVWEDMLVYGFLHFLIVVASLLIGSTKTWLIGFIVFWIVRSAGETLYFFLQQFIVPKFPPHNIEHHLKVLHRFLGNIAEQKSFILLQITMQSILVISICCLILVLRG
jgi:hypothetical protein